MEWKRGNCEMKKQRQKNSDNFKQFVCKEQESYNSSGRRENGGKMEET
jgi:hypothetical protein